MITQTYKVFRKDSTIKHTNDGHYDDSDCEPVVLVFKTEDKAEAERVNDFYERLFNVIEDADEYSAICAAITCVENHRTDKHKALISGLYRLLYDSFDDGEVAKVKKALSGQ